MGSTSTAEKVMYISNKMSHYSDVIAKSANFIWAVLIKVLYIRIGHKHAASFWNLGCFLISEDPRLRNFMFFLRLPEFLSVFHGQRVCGWQSR